MLTLADIRAQATAASFSKGQAYFEEGAVHRLRFREEDQEYTAIVSDSDEYDVQIGLDDGEEPNFWCNCPYDYEGICKHCVAVGLAVLENQEQQEQHENEPEETTGVPARKTKFGPSPLLASTPKRPAATMPDIVSASELETALRDVPKAEQLKFLVLHLRQNSTLARAFLTRFVGPPLPPDPLDADPTLPRLEELRDELRRNLSKLRFDYNTMADDYGNAPRVMYSYGPSGRFLVDLAARIGQVLAPVLAPAAVAMREALVVGRLAETLRRYQGAWLGIGGLKKPAADAYNLFFGDYYARQVADTWLALLPEMGVTKLLETQPFEPAEVTRCLPVFVRAVVEPLAGTPAPEPMSRGRSVTPPVPLPDADLALLLAVAANPSIAPALREALQPHAHRLTLELQLELAAGCHDWATWEPLALRQVAHNHDTVLLMQLLYFYHERERTADLVQLAEQHFGQHKSKQLAADFVLAHLTPAQSRPLYLKALTHRLEKDLDFADYEALTEIWTDKERAKYGNRVLVQMAHKFPPQFRARLLAHENRVAEILPLLLQFEWNDKKKPYHSWKNPQPVLDLKILPDLLRLTARHQPETTLDAVMERVENYLEKDYLRSIELYDHIAEWLNVLREVPVLEEQVTLFAEGLFSKYSKLSYLRKALRAAGLVPEPEARPPKPSRAGASPQPARKSKNPFGR